MTKVSVEYLRECFDMDECTGILTWRQRPRSHFKTNSQWLSWNTIHAGRRVGYMNPEGYLMVGVFYELYRVHRICWALKYGRFPEGLMDHIDGNRSNNAISNLRECTKTENNRNIRKRNSTGFKGVSRMGKKFRATIRDGSKQVSLGSFETPEEAHRAYQEAAKKFHGQFANFEVKNDGAKT